MPSLLQSSHWTLGGELLLDLNLAPNVQVSVGKQGALDDTRRKLWPISNKGDRYLRILLTHGARAVLKEAELPKQRISFNSRLS